MSRECVNVFQRVPGPGRLTLCEGYMKKIHGFVFGTILLCGAAQAAQKLPDATHFLFWTPAEQALGYRNIEKIFPTRVINRGPTVSDLPRDTKPFDVSYDYRGAHYDTAAFMKANNSSGLIVIHHGRI